MHRFKISELGENVFWLRDAERDHLVRVLRLNPGDDIIGFDNTGAEYYATVLKIEEKSVTCRILETSHPDVEAITELYLVVGLAKGEKMDWVIQKGTEMGIAGFVPLRAKRAVMRLEGNKAIDRVARWQKIAGEAAKQSHRVQEPEVFNVADWSELTKLLPERTQWLIPYEEEKTERLQAQLGRMDPQLPIALVIGPEGGFDPAEVTWAEKHLEAKPVSLGPRILRAETASLVATALVLAHFGDLG